MTVQEAIAYINDFTWSTSRLGLDRTRELLRRLGDPQDRLKFVHVAGTNGKGSTCAMIERILREAGYQTGFYPSPYIEEFRERIQVNGSYIGEEDLARITERVAREADAMEDHPSQFELITAIGMLYFEEQHCDIVVLEVGMGGALDSTNVIGPPEAAVITNIGLDHTEYLGDTLEKIALTKCGIIKSGSAAVSYANLPSVLEVIREVCREKQVPLYEAECLLPAGHDLYGQRFLRQGREYRLRLLGEHQLRNAAVALKVMDALRDRGWKIPEEAVERGLAQVTWPARFEVLSHEPLFILDGGHNPQCAEALTENLAAYLDGPSAKVTFLIGMLADKDYRRTLEILAPYGAEYICITPESHRALPAADLARTIREIQEQAAVPGAGKCPARAFDSIPEAISAALDTGRPVVAFGSLYSAGTIRSGYRVIFRKWLRLKAMAARRALREEDRNEKSRRISEELIRRIEAMPVKPRAILSYSAVWDEPDLSIFHAWAGEQAMVLAFPCSYPKGRMEAYVPESEDAWVTGAFGIRQPDPARSRRLDPREIDLVLVPCVGFDGQGGRLGHGGGYYDRWLPGLLPEAGKLLIAFEEQRLAEIPLEATDVLVPDSVTA